MPQINVAMLASRTQPLFSRASSITDDVSNVKNTFSSWDNCMKESYCKWPVIAAIIIVGLILLSIVWCIVRCACCGLSCCCGCFSCLKCCGECCGMCGSGKDGNGSHKNLDDQFRPQPQPTPYTGYQPPAPMGYEAPKYAQFETGKSGLAVEPKSPLNADALPAMPSWGEASTKHVLTEEKEEGMEMGNLTPDGQNVPLMSGGVEGVRTPGGRSPMNENGGNFFGGRGAPGQNGYMQGQPGGNLPNGPGGISRTGSPAMMNGRGGPGMNGPGMNGQGMNGRGMGYGDMAMAGAMGGPPRGQFNRSPGPQGFNNQAPGPQGFNNRAGAQGFNGGPNRGDMAMGGPPRGQFNQPLGPQAFNNQAQSPQDYNNQRPGFPPTAGYRGPPQRQYSNNSASPYDRGPQPQRQYSNDSGAPYPPSGPQRQNTGNGGFPQPVPQRQNTGNGGFAQPLPQRQYSSDTYRPSQDVYRPPASPSSPLNNSGGFDFNLGETTSPSRFEPPTQHHEFGHGVAQSNYAPSTTAPPSYATRAPQEQQRQFSPPPNEMHLHDEDHERTYSPIEEVHEMPSSEPVSRPDGGPAYPGYKPYSPAPVEAARNTPPPPSALIPGRPNY